MLAKTPVICDFFSLNFIVALFADVFANFDIEFLFFPLVYQELVIVMMFHNPHFYFSSRISKNFSGFVLNHLYFLLLGLCQTT